MIAWSAERSDWSEAVRRALRDILTTPSSPELTVAKPGEPEQSSESVVGPYELNDFFIFHCLRNGFTKSEILFLAEQANSNFSGEGFSRVYLKENLSHWLDEFYRRFAQAQYKRDSMLGGPGFGTEESASNSP